MTRPKPSFRGLARDTRHLIADDLDCAAGENCAHATELSADRRGVGKKPIERHQRGDRRKKREDRIEGHGRGLGHHSVTEKSARVRRAVSFQPSDATGAVFGPVIPVEVLECGRVRLSGQARPPRRRARRNAKSAAASAARANRARRLLPVSRSEIRRLQAPPACGCSASSGSDRMFARSHAPGSHDRRGPGPNPAGFVPLSGIMGMTTLRGFRRVPLRPCARRCLWPWLLLARNLA